jgi:hypothetical protein
MRISQQQERNRPMEEERMGRQRPGVFRSSISRAVAGLSVAAVLLAACGGGGGNGGNGGATAHTVHALVINASAADVTVTYVGAETIEEPLPTCKAALLDFPLADPFQILIDEETVIDTDIDLPDGLPHALDGYTDLIVEVAIDKEGVATFDAIRPGGGLTKPSTAAFCPVLPG